MEAIQANAAVGALGKSLETQKLGADLINKTLAGAGQAQPVRPSADQSFQQSVLAGQGLGGNLNISV